MLDGEIEGFYPVEIALVHFMLAADFVGFRLAQESTKGRHRTFKNVQTVQQQGVAAVTSFSRKAILARVKNTWPGAMAI